jgi:hypothetical protein
MVGDGFHRSACGGYWQSSALALRIVRQMSTRVPGQSRFVAAAAHVDNGQGYIGNEIAYSLSGHAAGITPRVARNSEGILKTTIKQLLDSSS